jgi:hypothetical protein
VEQLEVIRSMRQLKGETTFKRKDEYIDMGTVDKMREYLQYKKEKVVGNQEKGERLIMVKDGCEEANNNI